MVPGAREQAFIQRFYLYLNNDKAIQGALYQLYDILTVKKGCSSHRNLGAGILKGCFRACRLRQSDE